MKRKLLLITVVAGTLLTGYFYLNKADVTVKKEKTSYGEMVVQVNEKENTIETEFPIDMSEMKVQLAIHKMSHQKVLAKKKWGALPLTPERVKRLIQVVEENRREYANADLYLEILYEWEKDYFVNVIIAHNEIWDLQGGTIGRAYEIASPEEEMEFIQENFDVKQ
ncbi:DUF6241 domain-containing protein [Neobacillus niacini]|uniref:DUF6241 domain-containing protein n=1 Tax=Neobacillus niacini TaxID=86668 RepID=UPI0005EE3461|nr:DUF6241 domain-containing protein [Neobacillus niacini]